MNIGTTKPSPTPLSIGKNSPRGVRVKPDICASACPNGRHVRRAFEKKENKKEWRKVRSTRGMSRPRPEMGDPSDITMMRK